ncbi:heparanase-like protein 3 [Tanacetum coccineum]
MGLISSILIYNFEFIKGTVKIGEGSSSSNEIPSNRIPSIPYFHKAKGVLHQLENKVVVVLLKDGDDDEGYNIHVVCGRLVLLCVVYIRGLEIVKRKLQEVVEVRKCSWGDVRGLENVKWLRQPEKSLRIYQFPQRQRCIPRCDSRKASKLVFVWADEGTELKVDVTVVFKGEETVLANGSAVRTGTRPKLRLFCVTLSKRTIVYMVGSLAGSELGANRIGASILASQYACDTKTHSDMLRHIYDSTKSKPLIIAPDMQTLDNAMSTVDGAKSGLEEIKEEDTCG